MAEVRMPKMGDGMAEGTITSWLKREGDQVKEGDMIAEVETDKANVEIPAEESGVLARIVVPAGQTVKVGVVIAQIGEAGGAAKAGNGASAQASSRILDVAAAEASRANRPEDAAELRAGSAHIVATDADRIKASPLARNMARDLGIDLAQVPGTGPGGRIVERDITAFQSAPRRTAPALPAVPVVPRPGAPVGPAAAGFRETRLSKMRDAIRRRTILSKQTAPHFYVTMVIEMDRALGLLRDMNADAADGKITVSELILKASALALQRVPAVNASLAADGVVRQYDAAHIAFAVSIDEGLVMPVVKDCQAKSLRRISTEAKDLIVRARANQLKPEEYSGSTFSISNLGMMGVDEFIAIINPPEAAILAIGGTVREPAVVGDSDEIVIRSRMKITLSADHRIIDGAVAARFLQEVKKALESPFGLIA